MNHIVLPTAAVAAQTALGCLSGYLSGYIYGALFNADKALAAKVHAVAGAVGAFFSSIIGLATGGPKGEHRVAFYLSSAFNAGIVQAASIVALRHFELIATRGTVFYSFGLLMCVGISVAAAGVEAAKAEAAAA